MIAVPFGGGCQFIVIGSPQYLAKHGTPQTPGELSKHQCIRFRLPNGKMYRWEFERHGRSMKIEVNGPVTLDHMGLMASAAEEGLGLAYVLAKVVHDGLASGALVSVLGDWTALISGHHFYYPSSRLVPAALRAFIDVVKEVEFKRQPSFY